MSHLNIVITDGKTSVICRYVTVNGEVAQTAPAVSLYYAAASHVHDEGDRVSSFSRVPEFVIFASEPLWDNPSEWLIVPRNSVMVVTENIDIWTYPLPLQRSPDQDRFRIPSAPSSPPITPVGRMSEFPPFAHLSQSLSRAFSPPTDVPPAHVFSPFSLPKSPSVEHVGGAASIPTTTLDVCFCGVDQTRVAVAGSKGTIVIYERDTYATAGHLSVHPEGAAVVCLASSPSGLLYSGASDGTLGIHRVSEDGVEGVGMVSTGRRGAVLSLQVRDDGAVCVGFFDGSLGLLVEGGGGGGEGEEGVWEMDDGWGGEVAEGGTGPVFALACDGSGGEEESGESKIFASNDVKLRSGHTCGILSVLVEPGRRVFSGSGDASIRVWDISLPGDPYTVRVLTGHGSGVTALGADPLFSVVVSGEEAGDVIVWEPKGLTPLMRLYAQEHGVGSVTGLAVSGTGVWVSGSEGVGVWNGVGGGGGGVGVSGEMGGDGGGDGGGVDGLFGSIDFGAFIGMESVSGSKDTVHREGCLAAARFVTETLVRLGFETKVVRNPGGRAHNPVILARLGSDPSKKTVAFYGHYDVQPARKENGWDSDPFVLTGRDGYVYGRGVTDDKGPICAFLAAVEQMLPDVPVNLVVVIEGEEEAGSTGFDEVVEGNKEFLEGVEYVIVSNTYWLGDEMPCLTYGMRGVIRLCLSVKGPLSSLHSGVDGGVVREPLVDLMSVVSSLFSGPNGSFSVPGFEEHVRGEDPNADALLAILEEDGGHFDFAAYVDKVGESVLASDTVSEVLRKRWLLPSASVHGIHAGGNTRSGSVIPKGCCANLSIRIVPDQEMEDVIEKVRTHIETLFGELGTRNELSVSVDQAGPWWLSDPQSDLFSVAADAVEGVWGVRPVFVREGGSIPSIPFLGEVLGAEVIQVPVGQASDCAHLPNERVRVRNLVCGVEVFVGLLRRL